MLLKGERRGDEEGRFAMGLDPALFTLMTEAGPSEIIRVPLDLQIVLNVVNNGESPTVWSIETPPDGSGSYLN
jgi:hypothetical protein